MSTARADTREQVVIRPQEGPQTRFLACAADVVVYGGAAGGGKTWGLLLDALRYAALQPVRDFGAVIFRRTSPQITQQGGLWDEASRLYPLAGGRPNKTYLAWEWPRHNTRIRFGHMQYDQDRFNWQGAQIPYLGFDELTHFTAEQFFYMLSRNRSTCGVKPRVRGTTNPDADSWVKTFLAPWVDDEYPWRAEAGQVLRFYRENDVTYWLRPDDRLPAHIKSEHVKTATFIPSHLSDNPALLRANPEYEANLMALPPVERERLLGGPLAWKIRQSGNKFKRHWFSVVDGAAVPKLTRVVRYWDLAATEAEAGKDPDWTAGVKMGRSADGDYYILDVAHERLSPHGVDRLVGQTAAADGKRVTVYMEQEPGSSGKKVIAQFRRLLDGYDFRAVRPTGDKEIRANPLSSQAQGGNVYLVRAHWNEAFLNELCAFPMKGVHDDMVDAASGAYGELAEGGRIAIAAARSEHMDPSARQLFRVAADGVPEHDEDAEASKDDDEPAQRQHHMDPDETERQEREREWQQRVAQQMLTLNRLTGGNFGGFE